MKKNAIALIALAFVNCSYAGFTKLTYHSRSNCYNNESITWDLGRPHHLRTMSGHEKKDTYHQVDTGWQHTWRSASVHWGEGGIPGSEDPKNKWKVTGGHELCYDDGDEMPIFYIVFHSYAEDCSIADGW